VGEHEFQKVDRIACKQVRAALVALRKQRAGAVVVEECPPRVIIDAEGWRVVEVDFIDSDQVDRGIIDRLDSVGRGEAGVLAVGWIGPTLLPAEFTVRSCDPKQPDCFS
jgi:hypothetical protein